MAPSRGNGKAPAGKGENTSPPGRRRSKRPGPSARPDDRVADVYTSMVAEAEAQASARPSRPLAEAQPQPSAQPSRPLKRRRVAPRHTLERDTAGGESATPNTTSAATDVGTVRTRSGPNPLAVQTVEDSSGSDGSDLEFENVPLEAKAATDQDDPPGGIEDLSIAVQPGDIARHSATPRRKPATAIEKAHRLLVHKLHILCLLGHCMYVNGRCNKSRAQTHVRSVLASKTVSYLNPMPHDTQFNRDRSFMEGLRQAAKTFTAEYRVTGSGMMKPHWSLDGRAPELRETGLGPTDSSDFVSAAKDLQGSQDTGNQLFCTLLRAVGVDARVVCSLQPLPFSSAPKISTPERTARTTISATTFNTASPKTAIASEDTAIGSSKTIGKVPSARRRLGQPDFGASASQPPTPKKTSKPVTKLRYPVFWVEAFNEARQKWIAVDPIVTNTVNSPGKLEPPASYDLAQLTYVVAFEEDGSARDVTRRYAKAFNAKTRRHRVESSHQGAKWWKAVMRFYRRRDGRLDRDQVEDAELAQKEAREGMPGNVLDFKDHPYYALERHLKRHETIHPRREVGRVNAGTSAKPRMEPVFRRQDVHTCKSADKWYRFGRQVKEGEQPLKHVPARDKRQSSVDGGAEPAATTALYAPCQTQLYVPPPVRHGRIPKNVYGNLDVYVPSMVPAGGTHIRHALAQRAARLLAIDFADVVSGFKFHGHHGTAIIDGVVVAEHHSDAVHAVIAGIERELEEAASKARSLLALKMWKRFLTALRVAERVKAYVTAEAEQPTDDVVEDFVADPHGLLWGQEGDVPLMTAGQFTLAELSAPSRFARPKERKHDSDTDDDGRVAEYVCERDGGSGEEGDGFFYDHAVRDEGGRGGFLPRHDAQAGDGHEIFHGAGPDMGGGFPADAGSDHGGGFIPDDIRQQVESDGGGVFHAGAEADPGDDAGLEDDLFGENQQPRPEATVLGGRVQSQLEASTTSPRREAEGRKATEAGIDIGDEGTKDPKAPGLDGGTKPSSTASSLASKHSHEYDDKDEKGSLPSEDPDADDDAEPDWLESD